MIKKYYSIFYFLCLIVFPVTSYAQIIQDDFEGNGNINSWYGDNCGLDTAINNPVVLGINTSSKVLEYHDQGGTYANIRFDAGRNLNMSAYHTFSMKVYVPSSGISGAQNNQVSLKLQDGTLGAPWSTQAEIIKSISLDQWQTITFNFATDPFINFNSSSLPPTQRTDFNRILIQFNGENNQDSVLAYVDDFYYFDSLIVTPPSVYNQLVWSDEFNGTGALDSNKWYHQTQLPITGSWYNGEVQHYTDRTANSHMLNGQMNLIAKRETFTDQGYTKNFTSARLNSKFAFKYGKVVVRAKMPTGVGTWPAIWMLGKNIDEPGAYFQPTHGTTIWPACGEIDIMEHWGNNQNHVSSATHTPSSFGNTVNVGSRSISTVSSAFHIYELEWTPTKLIFSVDSIVHFVYEPNIRNAQTWPFDDEQYLIFNIAMQANTSANYSLDSMNVDYVRVYQAAITGVMDTEIKENSIEYYPNPVKDVLNIKWDIPDNEFAEVNLFDLNGKLIKSWEADIINRRKKLVGFNELANGVYFIQLLTDKKQQLIKLVK